MEVYLEINRFRSDSIVAVSISNNFKDLHHIHQTLTVHYWACYSKAFLWNKTFWGCVDVVDVRASLLVAESVYPRYKKQTSLLSFVLFKSKNHPERIIKAACVSQLRLNESSQPFPVGEPAIISHQAKCDLTDYPHDCLLPNGLFFFINMLFITTQRWCGESLKPTNCIYQHFVFQLSKSQRCFSSHKGSARKTGTTILW